MQSVVDAVERIRQLRHTQIGCNYGQGREALLRYLDELHKHGEWALPTNTENVIPDWIVLAQKQMGLLKEWLLPHQLPADYLYFLEYYGGLDITQELDGVPFFTVFGFFPPVLYTISSDELITFYRHPYWSEALLHSDVIAYNFSSSGDEPSYLYIGIWFDNHQLTDEDYQHIPINPATGKQYSPFEEGYPQLRLPAVTFYLDFAGVIQQGAIFASPDGSNKRMRKIADSFTKWLDRIAETRADFSTVASGRAI